MTINLKYGKIKKVGILVLRGGVKWLELIMKRRSVERVARFVSAGSGAVVIAAALFFFGKSFIRSGNSTVASSREITSTVMPAPEKPEKTESVPGFSTPEAFLVNINTASSKELQTLPGIGEAKADAIIAYREEHGDFDDISRIMNVSGIGEGIFENIREHITV